jgi:hypothetical protein
VQAIIRRVIRNAESANADLSRDFIIESLGIFGSVLADATSPGDVDVVFTGGLDFAIEVGLVHGGYIPRGRKAETDVSMKNINSWSCRATRTRFEPSATSARAMERLYLASIKLKSLIERHKRNPVLGYDANNLHKA